MKISFLVTYYNQAEYVRQSLDSILQIEKPSDWEILVGDDGSSDNTTDIVNEYIEKYPDNIKLFVMPRDLNKKYSPVKRASDNRLNLLEHSTGDIFCTLDGDDFYCDCDFVNKAIEIFESYSEISVVAFGFRYYKNEETGKDITLPGEMPGKIDKHKYLRSLYIHAGACVHRKNYGSKRIGYIRNIGFFDDNDIVINSLNYGELYSVPKAVYSYRQTGDSVYTSMNYVEQAVLNVQGLDVDLKLIDKQYEDSLYERYAYSLLSMYIWRNNIEKVLGTDKYQRYLSELNAISDSIGYEIIYADIDLSDRVNGLIKNIKRSHILLWLKLMIKYTLARIGK